MPSNTLPNVPTRRRALQLMASAPLLPPDGLTGLGSLSLLQACGGGDDGSPALTSASFTAMPAPAMSKQCFRDGHPA